MQYANFTFAPVAAQSLFVAGALFIWIAALSLLMHWQEGAEQAKMIHGYDTENVSPLYHAMSFMIAILSRSGKCFSSLGNIFLVCVPGFTFKGFGRVASE